VPLPGKWDTDKAILEMAGRNFYAGDAEKRDCGN
jgi:hypothetical protein